MSGWKITLIIIAIIAGFLLCVCSGIGLLVYKAAQGPSNIRVSVECPTKVAASEDFKITFLVKNTASRSQTINSIDIFNSYLDGFTINKVQPPVQSESSMFGMRTFVLKKEIQPGDQVAVTFDATAIQPGVYTGDADICINNQFTFTTRVLKTIVDE